jgi:hypothetical protein
VEGCPKRSGSRIARSVIHKVGQELKVLSIQTQCRNWVHTAVLRNDSVPNFPTDRGAHPVIPFSETWNPSGNPSILLLFSAANCTVERLPPRHPQFYHHSLVAFVVDQEMAMEENAAVFLEVRATVLRSNS